MMSVRDKLYSAYHYLRQPRFLRDMAIYWVLQKMHSRRYVHLSEKELKKTRTSDTLFICGSGWSLNRITPPEWEHISAHQTLGFNWFVNQDFVRMDYHLVKEITPDDASPAIWKPMVEEYGEKIRSNPRYANAIFILQGGINGTNGNRLLGLDLLPAGCRVARYKIISRGKYREPTSHLSEGLAHSSGTLASCVNFAYVMGYTNIVLTGVDLNDRRYFWLGENEGRPGDDCDGKGLTDKHRMANGTLSVFGRWTQWMAERGVRVSCYNPQSLLAEIMPIYDSPARRVAGDAEAGAAREIVS